MIDYQVYGDSLPETYHKALCRLLHGSKAKCSDWDTEVLECGMTMHVRRPLQEPMISRCFPGGPYELEQYRMEMLDGILDGAVEAGKLPYTYHSRIAKQLPAVIAELRRNPDTRRAVITVRVSGDISMPDPPCLQHIQFFIRSKRLGMDVLFRSNDAVKATFMNAFALVMLQKQVADELGIEVGTYTHRANSFHAYKRDWNTLNAYVARFCARNPANITYLYRGEWEGYMREAHDTIVEKNADFAEKTEKEGSAE